MARYEVKRFASTQRNRTGVARTRARHGAARLAFR
jgi:hypothetical protein